ASIAAAPDEVEPLMRGEQVVLAGLNSPHQTVVSGEAEAVAAVLGRARARGLRAVRLPVSHAFHSPLVAAAVPALAAHLARVEPRPPRRRVCSPVTGTWLAAETDLRALLCRQVTSAVRFLDALRAAAAEVDLWLEVGPGTVLASLLAECGVGPVVALDAGGGSLRGLLEAVGTAFALGAPLDPAALFRDRFTRPFALDWQPRFFADPCEQAPLPEPAAEAGDALPRPAPPAEMPAELSEPAATRAPLELVRALVAQRTELPLAQLSDDSRMLSDLHLSSIAVAQLVVEAARRLGLAPPVAPTDFADVTVAAIARALEEMARDGAAGGAEETAAPAGVDAWVRPFTVELVERERPRRRALESDGAWRIIAAPDDPLRAALEAGFAQQGGGGGVVVCLPPRPDERHLGLLLEGALAALEARAAGRFVLVQRDGGAASFARTLHLEAPELTTCVVDVPHEHPRAAEWVIEEALAASGYVEAHYDPDGRRRVPLLRALPPPDGAAALPLGPDDVLLVSGGGKGIGAVCALALARASGARLALLGRSLPDEDAELAETLRRLTEAGLRFEYLQADVTDPEAVRRAVRAAEAALGPITAVLHSAGVNEPRLLAATDEAALLAALAPKVQGARNLLAALDARRL